jgi:hypothetical protein
VAGLGYGLSRQERKVVTAIEFLKHEKGRKVAVPIKEMPLTSRYIILYGYSI